MAMRNVVVLAVCLSSMVLFGCPKKKGEAGSDAATDAPVAEADSAAPSAPEAANVGEIARFGDETKIDHETAKLAAIVTHVRKSPPAGELVTRLSPGTEVTKIASHEGQFLVTFANPKKPDERLMGWIAATAFTPAAPAAIKCKTDKECPAGDVCIPTDTGTKCEKSCSPTNTRACPEHSECKGDGPNAEGKVVQYCVSTLPQDAGAPPAVKDAGSPAKPDGGRLRIHF